jgi:MFS family permease
MMLIGIGALPVGVVVTLLALDVESLPLFFVGTAISGAAFGSGFQGGIRTVASRVAPHERAGVLSLLYVISYLGFGVPVVAAGFLIVHGAGLLGATRDYGAVVIVLAAAALLALTRVRRAAQ